MERAEDDHEKIRALFIAVVKIKNSSRSLSGSIIENDRATNWCIAFLSFFLDICITPGGGKRGGGRKGLKCRAHPSVGGAEERRDDASCRKIARRSHKSRINTGNVILPTVSAHHCRINRERGSIVGAPDLCKRIVSGNAQGNRECFDLTLLKIK